MSLVSKHNRACLMLQHCMHQARLHEERSYLFRKRPTFDLSASAILPQFGGAPSLRLKYRFTSTAVVSSEGRMIPTYSSCARTCTCKQRHHSMIAACQRHDDTCAAASTITAAFLHVGNAHQVGGPDVCMSSVVARHDCCSRFALCQVDAALCHPCLIPHSLHWQE